MFSIDEVRKTLFGGQKQSMRTNDAIVRFVMEYLDGVDEQSVVKAIQKEATRLLSVDNKEYTLSDVFFLQYILGYEAFEEIKKGAKGTVNFSPVGDKGKVMFEFFPASGTDVSQEFMDKYKFTHSEEGKKATTLEEEAWALIHKICDAVPPERRKYMPEDDALAAILLASDYYLLKG